MQTSWVAPATDARGALRILVVDDDSVDRMLVRRHLTHLRVALEIEEATSAEEALARVAAQSFDCAVLDYQLPGRDGRYVLDRLREVGIPVVMLSGQEDPEVAADLVKAGAHDYLSKESLTAHRLAVSVQHAVNLSRAHEAARATEQLNQSLMQASHDCVGILDEAGRLLSLNASGCRLLEIEDPSAVLGRDWLSWWAPNDRPRANSALGIARAGGIGKFEGMSPSSRGKPIWWEVVLSPVPPPHSGRPQKVLAVARDITDRRRREEFEQQLIGIVSHDLRNPVNAILLAMDSLRRSGALEAKQAELVERARRSADRAGRMIRDLLDFTRARLSGGIHIQPVAGDLREIVQAAVDELGQPYPGRIVCELPTPLAGTFDPDRMTQVVSNLLANALQYSPPLSRVNVRAWSDHRDLFVEVTNQGTPIPAERLDSIFEPLQRLRSEGSNQRSIGLGLYIVRQIVRSHSGSVRARSDAQGTVFTVSLPIVASNSPALRSADKRPLLLVDDDAEIRRAARELLELRGFEVHEAANGVAALEALQRIGGPCSIILDLNMPEMDGLAFLRKLQETGQDRDHRIVVASANPLARAQVEALRVRAVIQKPFDLERVLRELNDE
ncbi:MAG: response regulator [Myxococcales bacterium]